MHKVNARPFSKKLYRAVYVLHIYLCLFKPCRKVSELQKREIPRKKLFFYDAEQQKRNK